MVDSAHGFVVRCTQCKVHARKLDFKRVLALGPCVPIVPPVISPAAVVAAPLVPNMCHGTFLVPLRGGDKFLMLKIRNSLRPSAILRLRLALQRFGLRHYLSNLPWKVGNGFKLHIVLSIAEE